MPPIMNRLFPLSVVGVYHPLSSKTAVGVVSFNNETINAQNNVDMYHVQPDTSNTLKVAANHGANHSVTPS